MRWIGWVRQAEASESGVTLNFELKIKRHLFPRRLRQSFTRGRPPLLRPFEEQLALLRFIRLLSGQNALPGALLI
jgi:hypothetical protein